MEKICIKCAKCNPVCPTFLDRFDEVYAPRGYLHLCELINQGKMEAKEASKFLSICTKCGDCEPLCPIDLPIVAIITQALQSTLQESSSLHPQSIKSSST